MNVRESLRLYIAEMLGSCISVAALAMLYEGLKALRQYINVQWEREAEDVDSGLADDSGCCTLSVEDSKTATETARRHRDTKRCVCVPGFYHCISSVQLGLTTVPSQPGNAAKGF